MRASSVLGLLGCSRGSSSFSSGCLLLFLSNVVVVLDAPKSVDIDVLVELSAVCELLDGASTVGHDETSVLAGLVLLRGEASEADLAGDIDSLTTSKLHLCTTESLDEVGAVRGLGTNREDDVTDIDTGNHACGLTEGTTHTGLQTIGTCTGKHLVDTEDVEGVDTDTEVEAFLAGVLGKVLVGAHTGSLKSLRGVVLLLKGNKVDTKREVINTGITVSKIIHTDLAVRNTTAIARLDVWLAVLNTVAATRTSAHFQNKTKKQIQKKRKKNT